MKMLIIVLSAVTVVAAIYFVGYYISMRNVATPEFSVIKKEGNIELRRYQPMLVAEVTVSGERKQAINSGFRLLADYIFGNNIAQKSSDKKIAMTAPVKQHSDKIAMTAPVMQNKVKIDMTSPVMQGELQKNQWNVQFVMPAHYTLKTIPKPVNQQVKLVEVPAHKVIVIRFSGFSTDKNMQQHIDELKQYIKKNKLSVDGEPEFAFYNPPWTLPFMRRNEVMFRVND